MRANGVSGLPADASDGILLPAGGHETWADSRRKGLETLLCHASLKVRAGSCECSPEMGINGACSFGERGGTDGKLCEGNSFVWDPGSMVVTVTFVACCIRAPTIDSNQLET